MKLSFLFTISAFAFVAQTLEVAAADRESDSPDILIYGATPAGISAALAAAGGNRNVLLIEPTSRIGGMTTHGLSHSDFHSFEAQSGPFLHFSQRVLKHYRESYGENSEQVRDSWKGTHGEPSVNLLVFEKMLAEQPSITVLKNHRLVEATVANDAVTALRFVRVPSTLDGGTGYPHVTITPRLVIDASYEGDLLAAAGVPYRVGREARFEYGESLAPATADDELQGYNFRLCMTQDPENRVPIPVPENYNREDYAALVPLVEADKFRSAFGYPGRPFVLKAHLPILPNGKHDINDVSKGLVRLSLPGHNREYPEGDLATRRRIEQEHLDWQFGLIHFVQTDPALPEAFRKEAATWGLCRDEFADTDHIPPQIYVREARRMVGLHVYTEADTEYAPNDSRARLHSDSIAVGEYSHNCHGTGHESPMIGGKHTGEFYKGVAPYQIPYGVIVPKKLRNLLAPVACSASHVGFCALRLEPIWMSLGEAAGLAADLALDEKLPVQQVDVGKLQKRVWSRGGATIHLSDVPPDHPDFAAVQWWGNLGGWHGIEPAPKKPGTRGKHITSQYFEAFPGHAARLDQPLDEALRKRWTALAKQHGLPVPEAAATRGDWVRLVVAASRKKDREHLVRSESWTESWPNDSGGFEEREVTAEIWTAAMQASLDETGSLHIPARELPYYIDGPLILKSGHRITADPKAEIRLKPGCNTCMVRNANLVGFKEGPVPDETKPDTDIHIEGGTWTTLAAAKNELNGNARGHSSRQNWAFGTHGVILFQSARRISVKNVTVRKSKPFAIHLGNVHEFTIDGLTLEDHFRDGVHVNGPASQGTIRNIRGNSHDDPVALNAWEWKNYAPSYGPIRDVLVENVTGASSGTSSIRLLPGVKRFDDGTELDCPLENITLRRITDIREFKIYDQPNLEMGRDKDFSIGVGSIKNLRFEELVFNRPGKIELHANTDGLVIRDVQINHPIAGGWRLLAIGPKSMTWDRAKDPANWREVFSPDLDCTVRNVTVSGVRPRDSRTDLPIDRVVKVIELQPNPDYPNTTPKGGTGKGIWIR